MTLIQPYGDTHQLVTPTGISAADATRALQAAYPGIPVRAGLTTVLFADPTVPAADLEHALTAYRQADACAAAAAHVIPVTYTGEDLAAAATAAGISVEQLITAHTTTTWTVAMLGFAPGFPYLTATDPAATDLFSRIGRLATPRTRVPAGSVGVAAAMSCVYPSDMPGGWHLLGTTDITLFDPTAASPTLLTPGDLVSFTVKETA